MRGPTWPVAGRASRAQASEPARLHEARQVSGRSHAALHDETAQRPDVGEQMQPEAAQRLHGEKIAEQRAIEQIDEMVRPPPRALRDMAKSPISSARGRPTAGKCGRITQARLAPAPTAERRCGTTDERRGLAHARRRGRKASAPRVGPRSSASPASPQALRMPRKPRRPSEGERGYPPKRARRVPGAVRSSAAPLGGVARGTPACGREWRKVAAMAVWA